MTQEQAAALAPALTRLLLVNSRVMWTSRCRVVCTTQSRLGIDHEANPEPVMVR
jgi:hypothetical protein